MTPYDELKKIREELKQKFLERSALIDGAQPTLRPPHPHYRPPRHGQVDACR